MKAFLSDWFRRREEKARRAKMILPASPACQLPVLAGMEDVTLVRMFSHLSMGLNGLVALEKPPGEREIQFGSVRHIDLPRIVHHARFELATDEDRQRFIEKFLPDNPSYFRPNDLLVVAAEEGRFFICANSLVYLLGETEHFYSISDKEAIDIMNAYYNPGV